MEPLGSRYVNFLRTMGLRVRVLEFTARAHSPKASDTGSLKEESDKSVVYASEICLAKVAFLPLAFLEYEAAPNSASTPAGIPKTFWLVYVCETARKMLN